MIRRTVSFLLVLLVCINLPAQRRNDPPCGFGSSGGPSSRKSQSLFRKRQLDNNTIVKYKLEYLHGVIINHIPERIGPLIDKNTSGVELAVEFPKYGGRPWHFYYAFPTVGVGAMYLNLGNKEMLGSAFTVYPYINIPIWQTQLFAFNLKMGVGAAYITKKFDKNGSDLFTDNNFAIGSHLNGFLTAGVNTEIKLSRSKQSFISRFSVTADAGIQHFSNGSVQKPNAGLNVFTVAAGVKYTPSITLAPMSGGTNNLSRKWMFEPVIAAGVNQQHFSDPKKYLNMSLSIGAFKPLANVYRIGFSADAFYNRAYFKERIDPYYYEGEDSKFRAGVSVANELIFGNFTAGLHIGLYVFNPISHDGLVYCKLAGKYRFYDNLFVMAALKTHLQVAENIEVGIGYSFSRKDKAPFTWMPEKKKKDKIFFGLIKRKNKDER